MICLEVLTLIEKIIKHRENESLIEKLLKVFFMILHREKFAQQRQITPKAEYEDISLMVTVFTIRNYYTS